MEIIEKQVEKVKEVPTDNYGYGYRGDIRGFIPQSVTHADVYVAINAQYHDYCELFKSWFNDGIEQKIIESAVVFWFKDDDYKDGFKLWNYFKED